MADQILRPHAIADDAGHAAAQRLRHHQTESFLERRQHEHGGAAEGFAELRLRDRTVEFQRDVSAIRREIPAGFAEHGAVEVHPPAFAPGERQRIEQRLQPFAQAELPGEDDPKLAGRRSFIREKQARIGAVRNHPNLLPRDPRTDELIAHEGGRRAVPVAQGILFVLAGKVGVVIRTGFRQTQAGARIFRLHDPHPCADRAGGVIEHRADAEPPRRTEDLQALARHRVDEIARGEMRAHPAIEAMILPAEKRPRWGAQVFRHVLEEAIDHVRAQAVGTDREGVGAGEFPARIAGVVAAERVEARHGHGERMQVARVRRGDGNLHAAGSARFRPSVSAAIGCRTSRIQAR